MKTTFSLSRNFCLMLLALLSWMPAHTHTTGGNCPLPSGLSVLSTDGITATLGWNAIPGISRYAVQVENANNNPVLFNVEQFVNNATQYTVTGLQPNGGYKFKVRSYCDNGDNSDWTDWVSFNSSGGGNCDTPPSGLSVIGNGGNVVLSWSAVGGASGYSYEVENASGNPVALHLIGNTANTSVEVTGLMPNAAYKFKVRTNCGGSHSDWTAWFEFGSSTGGGTGGNNSGACSTPTGIQVSVTAGVATVTWAAVNGATAYQVEVEDALNNPQPFAFTTIVGVTSVTVPGLAPNQNYKVKVRTICGTFHSVWSDWGFFNSNGSVFGGGNTGGNTPACPQPVNLQATNLLNNSATLQWNAVSGALSYTIEVEQVQGPNLVEQVVQNNQFQMTNLLPGTAYKFKVRSNCGLKHSDWTNWFTFVTPNNLVSPGGSNNKSTWSPTIELKAFPNPVAQGQQISLQLEGPAGQDMIVRTVSLTGKVVSQWQYANPYGALTETLNVSQLAQGLYFIQVSSGTHTITQRLMITE